MRQRYATVITLLALMTACSDGPVADDPDDVIERYTVRVDPGELELIEAQSATLNAAVANAAQQPRQVTVHWSSSNAAVARVDSTGLVTALAAGEAYIVASALEARDSAVVRVVRNRVSISPASATRPRGTVAAFQATVNGAGSLRWQTADTTIAIVYSDGRASARRAGTTAVQAILIEDARHSAAAEMIVDGASVLVFTAAVEAITRTATRDVVDPAQLSGTVDVHVLVSAPAGSYTLQLLIDGTVAAQLPHATGFDWRVVPLATTAFANGTHALSLRVLGSEGQPLVNTAATAIGIVNP